MICKNCGWQNIQGSRFCERCGQMTAPEFNVPRPPAPQTAAHQQFGYGYSDGMNAPPVVSSWPPPQMQPMQPQPGKKKKTLIIALTAGGALVVIAAILIAVLSGSSPVEGIWYSEDLGVVLVFERGGVVVSHTPEGHDEGNYTFNSNSNKGVIKADGDKYDFRLEGRRIQVQGIGTFEKAVKNFDIEEFLEDSDGQNES